MNHLINATYHFSWPEVALVYSYADDPGGFVLANLVYALTFPPSKEKNMSRYPLDVSFTN